MNADQSDTPTPRVPAPPLPRLAAFALDAATYLIIPALLLPVGLLLIRYGVTLGAVAVNAIGVGDCSGHRLGYLARGPATRSHPG
jgi:hypothetical protein